MRKGDVFQFKGGQNGTERDVGRNGEWSGRARTKERIGMGGRERYPRGDKRGRKTECRILSSRRLQD